METERRFGGALIAKGAFVIRLPWLLGGDTDAGLEFIGRALVVGPTSAAAQRALERAIADQGRGVLPAFTWCQGRGEGGVVGGASS